MSFSPQQLEAVITQFSSARTFWVAYSGGSDSHVLLRALSELRSSFAAELKAIHINHGLSGFANEWEVHCQQECEKLGVEYKSIKVNPEKAGASPEAAAREARYNEWQSLLDNGDVIFLAHHQDDQAETVLLQLMRGAGVKGLAAMPEVQSFAKGYLCRPLLNFSRETLTVYASQLGLNWIDDPSNFDTDFDRNFLRHEAIPLLESRWPGLKKVLSRSAGHYAEASQMLNTLALADWDKVKVAEDTRQLDISALQTLPMEQQRNVIRYWISDVNRFVLPGTVHLNRIFNEIIPAADDASPIVSWQDVEVRRYQQKLYVMQAVPEVENAPSYDWTDLSEPLEIYTLPMMLEAKVVQGQGISQAAIQGKNVSIRFRQGGESCRPDGRGNTQELKKLFQQWGIPPWLRNQVPLVYIENELAQVVGYCICEPYACSDETPGFLIQFTL